MILAMIRALLAVLDELSVEDLLDCRYLPPVEDDG
jgi:hypothetical protein